MPSEDIDVVLWRFYLRHYDISHDHYITFVTTQTKQTQINLKSTGALLLIFSQMTHPHMRSWIFILQKRKVIYTNKPLVLLK